MVEVGAPAPHGAGDQVVDGENQQGTGEQHVHGVGVALLCHLGVDAVQGQAVSEIPLGLELQVNQLWFTGGQV